MPPTDSRLRPDQRHLESGEFDAANAEKLRLEQKQRRVSLAPILVLLGIFAGGVCVSFQLARRISGNLFERFGCTRHGAFKRAAGNHVGSGRGRGRIHMNT